MPRKSRKNVGLIGLGIIGSRVANALRHGGFHVYVWNRTPRAAPNFLSSPADVAELCDVIQIFVSDAQALFEVLDAMSGLLTEQHVIICNATIGPEAVLEAARLVQGSGAKFLDAPFTGSKAAAENRQLVYYIGGDDEVFRRAEPMLKASSKEIVKIGKIGDAATVKIATNMLAAVTVQTLSEAIAIVKKSGISAEVFADAMEHHGARSGLIDMKLNKIIHRDFEPHFSLKHMFKDVQIGIHIANALEIDIPATTATAGVMFGGLNRGWADLDFAAIAKIYESEKDLAPPRKENPPAQLKQPEEASKPVETEPPKETLSHMAAPPRQEAGETLEIAATVISTEPKTADKDQSQLPKNGSSPEKKEASPEEKIAEPQQPEVAAQKNRLHRFRRWLGTNPD